MRGSYNGDYKTDYNAEEKSAYGYYKRYFKSVGEEFPPVLINECLIKLKQQLLQPFGASRYPTWGIGEPIGKVKYCQFVRPFFYLYSRIRAA